jgi:hypothetical protein
MTGRIRVPDDTAGNLIHSSHCPFGPVYESPTSRSCGLDTGLPTIQRQVTPESASAYNRAESRAFLIGPECVYFGGLGTSGVPVSMAS